PGRAEIMWLRGYLLTADEKVDEAIALLQGGEQVEPQAEGSEGPAGSQTEASGQGALDLTEVLALKEEGKTADAAMALEELLAARLGEAGFAMAKKKQLNAMEKMKLMMQQKQGQ
ncbi:MAG: hypothetical protein JSV70_03655, partial [bacterium]